MATNLQIDDRLINRALELGHHPTKKAAVTFALTQYIHHLQQHKILKLIGSVDDDPSYDPQKQRARG